MLFDPSCNLVAIEVFFPLVISTLTITQKLGFTHGTEWFDRWTRGQK